MFMSPPCPLHKSVLIFSCGLFRNTDFLFRLVSKRFQNNETNLIFCFAKMTETDPKQNEHQFVSVRTGTNNYLFRGHPNFKPSRKTLINIKYQHSTSGLSSPLSHPVAIYTVQIQRSFFTSLHYVPSTPRSVYIYSPIIPFNLVNPSWYDPENTCRDFREGNRFLKKRVLVRAGAMAKDKVTPASQHKLLLKFWCLFMKTTYYLF